jgi:DNA-binding beta-propeller fold protein YncE
MKTSTKEVFRRRCGLLAVSALASGALLSATPALAGDGHALLAQLKTISTVASTVPGNGDVNPYGVALVRRTTGNLRAGHVLVSNFNNSGNFQGTGSTIVDVAPDGTVSLFAALSPGSLHGSCPGGIGLTTALVALEQGWVIVGSLPTAVVNATTTFTGPGCLIVLDSLGNPVETFYGSLINGPWDMTAFDGEHEAKLFVTNVLNGTVAANGSVVNGGTVTRLDLKVSDSAKPVLESVTVIGSGFPERTDPAALVIGPTGVGLHANCASDGDDCGDHDSDHDGARLYVADTLNNRIAVIDHPLHRTTSAGTGHTLTAGGSLNAPLGLIVVPGGDVLTVNGGDGNILEFSPEGAQRGKELIDSSGSPPGAGALFGLAFDSSRGIYYVDDATNTLNLLH